MIKPAIIIFICLAMSLTIHAQGRQQQKVDSVFKLVKKYFNLKNADAIYNLAGQNFQRELSITTFSDVATHQLFPLGELGDESLVSFVNNSLATYKVKLGANTLQLLISLDRADRLETLLFQPYQEPLSNKTALVPTSNPLRSMMDRAIDTVARTYIQKASTVGLCIGIIKNGQTSVYSYGETVRGNGKLPNADNFFEIGSITKTFTATLLTYYVTIGKARLTYPIIQYLPDSVALNQSLKSITLQMLINHTSGLANLPDNMKSTMTDVLNPYKDYTTQQLFSYLKNCGLNSKPGEKYAYSNLGVGLLGNILQSLSGQTFEQTVKEVICRPLAMLSTAQYLNPLLSPRFVSVYNAQGQPTPAWDFDALASCGALRSTMNDLIKYVKANMSNAGKDELSKAIALTHRLTLDGEVKIGLGWHAILIDGEGYYFHNGGTYGSNSFIAFNPKKGTAIIVLSNAFEPTDPVGAGILRKIQ